MALLAESLVDEWLNRAGFFTVRGIKHGVGEIDLLGVRPAKAGLEAWHVEVQASFRPISYIAPLPDDAPKGFAKSKMSMKVRPPDLVERAAAAWVEKKFKSKSKCVTRAAAWAGLNWKFVLVHAAVRWPAEVEAISRNGVEVIPLHRVLCELGQSESPGLRGSAGTDLSEVIEYFYRHSATDTQSRAEQGATVDRRPQPS
ncbi:hypothetical protein [Zavarzinella formosa]|uniref:hypothetical protein n=1 Tax=Zavarzinella formosa TaxID=360055 RepID=UPI000364178D|nr:hypothetical protein [Zavarzinella formosa]